MRIVDKNLDESENRFLSPLKKKIIYEKRKMLEEMLIKGEEYQEMDTVSRKPSQD